MRWLNSLERRFGSLAVPGLIRVVVAINAVVCFMILTKPDFAEVLRFQPDKVMHGEFWRVFSYVFVPPISSANMGAFILFSFFYLSMLWLMGEGLEQAWGNFKLNVYYLFGWLGTTISVLGVGAGDTTGSWLNTSLFFAFATLFPNYPILLYFIPVRVKWIALVSFALMLLSFLAGSVATKVAILISLGNYILFFGPAWLQQWREDGRTVKRRQQFQVAQQQEVEETLHHCKICGATEVSAPEKEFRVAADGEEYCLQHLPSRRPGTGAPPPLPEGVGREK